MMEKEQILTCSQNPFTQKAPKGRKTPFSRRAFGHGLVAFGLVAMLLLSSGCALRVGSK